MRRQPAPGEGDEESSDEEDEEDGGDGEDDAFAQLPEATKGLRACRKCRLIKEFQQVRKKPQRRAGARSVAPREGKAWRTERERTVFLRLVVVLIGSIPTLHRTVCGVRLRQLPAVRGPGGCGRVHLPALHRVRRRLICWFGGSGGVSVCGGGKKRLEV